MIKTLEQCQKLAEGNQKNAWYELFHLNRELKEIGKRADIIKQSSCYAYHIALVISDIDRDDFCWYSATNDGGQMHTFKNWAECFSFVNGMRMVYYHGLNK